MLSASLTRRALDQDCATFSAYGGLEALQQAFGLRSVSKLQRCEVQRWPMNKCHSRACAGGGFQGTPWCL